MAGKSNGQIKAIETVYKGYRFRSRLEARWAVFFDALGIHYRYELEGLNTQYGNCLLYTSDAADERSSVDLGGRRIIKKKNKRQCKVALSTNYT